MFWNNFCSTKIRINIVVYFQCRNSSSVKSNFLRFLSNSDKARLWKLSLLLVVYSSLIWIVPCIPVINKNVEIHGKSNQLNQAYENFLVYSISRFRQILPLFQLPFTIHFTIPDFIILPKWSTPRYFIVEAIQVP